SGRAGSRLLSGSTTSAANTWTVASNATTNTAARGSHPFDNLPCARWLGTQLSIAGFNQLFLLVLPICPLRRWQNTWEWLTIPCLKKAVTWHCDMGTEQSTYLLPAVAPDGRRTA